MRLSEVHTLLLYCILILHDLTRSDLRAVLKLQPTNAEALAELQSLVPPSSEPSTPTSSSSASISSSPFSSSSSSSSWYSSSSSPPPLPTTLDKMCKYPPWPRTKADERRLKIVLFPASLEDFARECLCESVECPHHSHLHDHDGHGNGAGNGGGKKRRDRGYNKKDETDGKCSRLREVEEIIKSETIVYPSWERYYVKRAD